MDGYLQDKFAIYYTHLYTMVFIHILSHFIEQINTF